MLLRSFAGPRSTKNLRGPVLSVCHSREMRLGEAESVAFVSLLPRPSALQSERPVPPRTCQAKAANPQMHKPCDCSLLRRVPARRNLHDAALQARKLLRHDAIGSKSTRPRSEPELQKREHQSSHQGAVWGLGFTSNSMGSNVRAWRLSTPKAPQLEKACLEATT